MPDELLLGTWVYGLPADMLEVCEFEWNTDSKQEGMFL
jgi:hypothetical protein